MIGIVGIAGIIIAKNQRDLAAQPKSAFATTAIPLSDVTPEAVLGLAQVGQLSVNGTIKVNGALILKPQDLPQTANSGEIFYDKTTNQIYYYNGSQFSQLATNATVVTGINNAAGAITLGSGLTLSNNVLSSNVDPSSLTGGVLSIQGQSGNITLTGGTGITVSGTTITNSGVTRLAGITGDIAVGPGLGISGSTLTNTLNIDTNTPTELEIINNGNGTIYINKLGAGAGGTVALGPVAPQTDSSTNTSININKTGASGGLVSLAVSGSPTFVVSRTGEITYGSIDYSKVLNTPGLGVTSLGTVNGSISLGIGLNIDVPTKTLSIDIPSAGNFVADVTNPNVDSYQNANIKLKSKNSAYTAVDISGTTGQTADVLQVKADSVANSLFAVSAAGVSTFQPSANATSSFRIYNSSATPGSSIPIFSVNSSLNRVGINNANPQYALDVNGVINASDSLKVNGVDVCTTAGCLTIDQAGNFVKNDKQIDIGRLENIALVNGPQPNFYIASNGRSIKGRTRTTNCWR
jgi:hypothetical protein